MHLLQLTGNKESEIVRTQYIRRKPTKSQQRKTQRKLGIVLLILSAIVIAVGLTGTTIQEKDIGPVLILAPMGLWLIFTKEIII